MRGEATRGTARGRPPFNCAAPIKSAHERGSTAECRTGGSATTIAFPDVRQQKWIPACDTPSQARRTGCCGAELAAYVSGHLAVTSAALRAGAGGSIERVPMPTEVVRFLKARPSELDGAPVPKLAVKRTLDPRVLPPLDARVQQHGFTDFGQWLSRYGVDYKRPISEDLPTLEQHFDRVDVAIALVQASLRKNGRPPRFLHARQARPGGVSVIDASLPHRRSSRGGARARGERGAA